MQTKEEMLDIFLEETRIKREDVISYKKITNINFLFPNRPIYFKRPVLCVRFKSLDFTNERLYQSDRYELVTDEEEGK